VIITGVLFKVHFKVDFTEKDFEVFERDLKYLMVEFNILKDDFFLNKFKKTQIKLIIDFF